MVSPKEETEVFISGLRNSKLWNDFSFGFTNGSCRRNCTFSFIKSGKKCTLVYTGDGGASEGDFHEAVNTAAVWNLPVIIVVENNQWGLSTPSREQFRCKSFADKGIGYGIEAHSINGNNILGSLSDFQKFSRKHQKNPRPILVECNTFRLRGHEEASGTAYYPEGMIEEWTKQDPITNYEQFLLSEGILNQNLIEEIKNPIKNK